MLGTLDTEVPVSEVAVPTELRDFRAGLLRALEDLETWTSFESITKKYLSIKRPSRTPNLRIRRVRVSLPDGETERGGARFASIFKISQFCRKPL